MVGGVRIRPAETSDIDDLIKINIAVWRSTYREMIHDDVLNSMTPNSLRNKWERTVADTESADRRCYVAVLNGDLVGYVVCGKNRDENVPFDWELYAIYLLAEHQGKGIGKQLFKRAIEDMKGREVRSFILFVLEENHATRKFYELFKPDHQTQRIVELAGRPYAEIGYGWSDILKLK
jgi:ribosomal protein S18 acetylase RimI-like enzyme